MKPKALLSLLAVAGAFLNGEMTAAQTVQPILRTPQADNVSGIQGSELSQNVPVNSELDRQGLSYGLRDFLVPKGGINNFKDPENRDLVSQAHEGLFLALNGLLNHQGANFLSIDPNSMMLGVNTQLNISKDLLATSTISSVDLFDLQGQQYTVGNNFGSDASFPANVSGRINLDNSSTVQTSPQPRTAGNISDTKIIANSSKPINSINESGSTGKGSTDNVGITPTGDVSISSNMPQSNNSIGNESQSVKSSDTVDGASGKENRVDIPAKMAIEPQHQGKSSADRVTMPTSVRKIDLIDVSLIVSNDLTVKKDDLGDLKIYTTGTLGITNSSSISGGNFSRGKTADISLSSDRLSLNNPIIQTQSSDAKGKNIQITTLDRLLLKNLSSIVTNSGRTEKNSSKDSTAPKDTGNRLSLACDVSLNEHKFTGLGHSGLIASAKDPLTSDVVLQDALGIDSQSTIDRQTTNSLKLAIPNTGWLFDGEGKVTITAMGTEIEPMQTSIACPNVVRK
jgi:filamentous hemagglutinin family protein